MKKACLSALIAVLIITVSLCACVSFGEPEPKVVINEVVTSNGGCLTDEALGTPDWIELYNPSDKALSLAGWTLEDGGGQGSYAFPNASGIDAKGYIVLLCGGADGPAFGLSKNGDSLTLKDAEGSIVQRLSIPALDKDISYARDGESWGFSFRPTPGAANADMEKTLAEAAAKLGPREGEDEPAQEAGMLLISELQNGGGGWAELYNASDTPLELSRYYLSDDPAQPKKYRLPDKTLMAGEYIVIDLTGEGDGFKLGKSEDRLLLCGEKGETLAEAAFDPELPDELSAVFEYDNGIVRVLYTSHITKGEPNSEDVFAGLYWREGDMSVVVNELLPDNKYGITDSFGDRSDWVELYNPTDTALSLAGYYLTDELSDPDKWALPDVTLGPGEYLIVFLSGRDIREGELHASFGISKKDEGVFLCTWDGMKYSGLTVPEGLAPNVSIGRDGEGNIKYYAAPTPGRENGGWGMDSWEALGVFDPRSVYISEVSGVSWPKGSGYYASGPSSDWAELYNGSAEGVDLSGWSLTDDPDEPRKYPLDGLFLPADGYLLCKSAKDPETGRLREISLSASGDTLLLFDEKGALRDVFVTGVTMPGVTSGRERLSQSGDRVFFTEPTPGRANGAALASYAAEPVFSLQGLYCEAGTELTLTSATPGAIIRYTLDGTEPTAYSRAYSGPIKLDSSCAVRAKAYAEGLAPSACVTHTYVLGSAHSLPAVCISLAPADLDIMYTAEIKPSGGVIHGGQVSCNMEYYIDGREAFSTGAGIRVSGASTSVYPQKSLALYFRAGYGRSSLDFPLFRGCDVKSFRSIVLRNAGQDAYYARIRDAYMSRVCQGLDIDVSYVEPTAVFINGRYWGIYDLKENLNEDYLAAHYGVDRDDVEIIKRNSVALAGTKTAFMALREFCRTADFSNNANFEKLREQVDTESFIDYLCARCWFYDGDMFNQKYWRTTDGTVKWRAVFYDCDYAMFGGSPAGDVMKLYFDPRGVKSFHGSITNTDIYCALVQNAGWRDAFILRYVYLAEYVFCPENALPIFDELVEEYAAEIPAHFGRWSGSSVSNRERELGSLRSCIERRSSYALSQLRSLFSLTEGQLNEYKARAAAIHNGQSDPGGSFVPAAPPTPAPTPTPGPTNTPEPEATPAPTGGE